MSGLLSRRGTLNPRRVAGGGGAGDPVYRDVTFASAAYGGSTVVSLPTNVDGDLLVLATCQESSDPTLPSGWGTALTTATYGSRNKRLSVYTKIAAGEPASYTLSLGSRATLSIMSIADPPASQAAVSGPVALEGNIPIPLDGTAQTGQFLYVAFINQQSSGLPTDFLNHAMTDRGYISSGGSFAHNLHVAEGIVGANPALDCEVVISGSVTKGGLSVVLTP